MAVLPLYSTAFQTPQASQRVHLTCQRSRSNGTPSITYSKKNNKDDENQNREDEQDIESLINPSVDPRIDLNKWSAVNFTQYEDKILDRDAAEYGWIRFREPLKQSTPMDQPTLKEIELYNKRMKMLEADAKREQLIDKWFGWVTPLLSFFIPMKYYPSSKRPIDGIKHKRILSGPNSARNTLVLLNIVAYIYQIVTAVQYLPGFNRILASSIAGDAISAASIGNTIPQWSRAEVILRALGIVGGGSGVVISSSRGIAAHSMGPFFLDWAHQPYPMSYYQRHRYLTSGFLHGSLVHLGMNVRALLSLPGWLESGIGRGVYLTAYLVAIIAGNVAHTFSTFGELPGCASSSLCIGASGGICGLYGLMFASLWRISSPYTVSVFQQMLWLIAFGYLVPNISVTAHIGGFLGGCLVGYLFGPGYFNFNPGRTRRDRVDSEFRSVLGPGKSPNPDEAILHLQYLWTGVVAAMIIRPDLRTVPMAILKGVCQPGSVSNIRRLLIP